MNRVVIIETFPITLPIYPSFLFYYNAFTVEMTNKRVWVMYLIQMFRASTSGT